MIAGAPSRLHRSMASSKCRSASSPPEHGGHHPKRGATGPNGIVVIEIALRSAYGDSRW